MCITRKPWNCNRLIFCGKLYQCWAKAWYILFDPKTAENNVTKLWKIMYGAVVHLGFFMFWAWSRDALKKSRELIVELKSRVDYWTIFWVILIFNGLCKYETKMKTGLKKNDLFGNYGVWKYVYDTNLH